MDVVITLPDSPDAHSDFASLLDWLRQEDELRGRVRQRQAPIEQGQMGSVSDILTVMVGSGGAVTVLLGSIATWLKNRRSDVTIDLSLGDNKIRIEGKRIKADPASMEALIAQATNALHAD
jgi:hypothetical protein